MYFQYDGFTLIHQNTDKPILKKEDGQENFDKVYEINSNRTTKKIINGEIYYILKKKALSKKIQMIVADILKIIIHLFMRIYPTC